MARQKRQVTCHPGRVHRALGLCGPCYHEKRNDIRHPNRKRRHTPIVTCHPGRKHQANGLCAQCYLKKYRQQNITRLRGLQDKCIKTNPELYRLHKVKFQLKAYGLTVEDYRRMYGEQLGKCAICRINGTSQLEKGHLKTRLCVDHDHATGKIRGLLCHICNQQLGILEKTDWVRAATSYLDQEQKVATG